MDVRCRRPGCVPGVDLVGYVYLTLVTWKEQNRVAVRSPIPTLCCDGADCPTHPPQCDHHVISDSQQASEVSPETAPWSYFVGVQAGAWTWIVSDVLYLRLPTAADLIQVRLRR